MAKNKRRKRHIIRRRVMRTMAAITMIMAVAIASIPVENFGTMRAAEEAELAFQDRFDMDEIYQKYGKAPDASTDGEPIQRIDGNGNVKDAYKVKLGTGGTGVISGIADASADAVSINETEYYDFVMYTKADIDDTLKDISITVAFDEDTALGNAALTQSELADVKNKYGELGEIDSDVKKYAATYAVSSSTKLTLPDIANGTDKNNKGSLNSEQAKTMVEALWEGTLNAYVTDYNTDADALKILVDNINAATDDNPLSLTDNDIELWNKFATGGKYYDRNSFTINDFAADANSNNLSDAYEYIICNAYLPTDGEGAKYELVQGTYKGEAVYLPRLKEYDSEASIEARYLSGGNVTITEIGKSAFKDAGLTSIEIPASVKKIDDYCFMGNGNLTDVVFQDGDSVKIGAYAFYNCPNLQAVTFSNETKYEMGEGAFALDQANSDKDKTFDFSFIFPKANDKVGSDYILAGRKRLALVKFTENIGGTIPANTLRGCSGLRTAIFETADASYDTSREKEDQLFADVINPYFMVEGPAFNMGNDQNREAEPKKSSAKAIYAYFENSADNFTWKSVPYKYTGEDGKDYIDIGYEEGKCVATIAVEGNSTDATLVKYFAKGLNKRVSVTIPKNAGNYMITKIGSGCFDDKGNEVNELKSNIYELTIEDYGYLTEIGEGAFSGCPKLEWVNVGNSVETIGANAFAQCPRLQNVKFSRNGSNLKYLDASAFDTSSNGAPYLTFYGDIKSGYAPFDFAMSDRKMDQTGAHICYKTGAPENLTVIWSNETGVTLVDYPHYDEIDSINSNYINEKYGAGYSIQTTFESYLDAGSLADITDVDIVDAAFEIDLPDEITSIDTASFFGSDLKDRKNVADEFYLKNKYVFEKNNLSGSKSVYETKDISADRADIIAKYSQNGDAGIAKGRSNAIYDVDYARYYNDKNVARGGLFSGYFAEQGDKEKSKPGMITREYKGIVHEQAYTSGNDNITNVSMPGVTELPDYAFDSCENLRTAAFGGNLLNIGELPFRNDKNMETIDLGTPMEGGGSRNNKYVFKDKILYEQDGAGYKIIEMLESRTELIGKDEFKFLGASAARSLGTGVTSIAPGAFSNNENLSEIDLSGAEITEIPADCFKNSAELRKIVLPPTVKLIDEGALKNVKDVILEIPADDCVIDTNVADRETKLRIVGKEKDDEGKLTELGKSVQNLSYATFTDAAYDASSGNDSSGSNPSTIESSEIESGGSESGASQSSSSETSSSQQSSTSPSTTETSSSQQSSTPPSTTPPSSSQTNESQSSERKYKLKVIGGIINGKSGEGEFAAGEKVDIEALAPDAPTKVFSRWSSNNENVVFKSATLSKTSFIMPASGSELVVTANYTTRINGDDEDGSTGRRSGTTTTVTPATTTSANTAKNTQATPAKTTTTTTTTTTTGTADNNGNRIYITKDGISNQDVASVAVDGSTDNFIAKISESDEAAAAAGQALINTYGSLDGIVYFPMDISLYDVSGQNKLTDTYGLNVTVTIPIPDVLIQYGGNARVAACDNGNLQQLTPRFTTINGIACMSFVPPHFSPYVIYVDTNNLTAGQMLDQTPKTGDPIHPKWFLAMGMACLSVVLFVASDGRRRRGIKAA